MIIFEFKTAV